MHNFLQEKIMHFEGFKYGWFLGFLEVRALLHVPSYYFLSFKL